MSSSSEQEDLEVQEDSSEDELHSDDDGIEAVDTEDEGESEAGESEADNSEEDVSNAQVPDLDASSTESDEDDDEEVDDDEDVPKVPKVEKSIPKIDKITQDVQEKYKKRQGRQLYIRFPEKLPESAEEFQTKVKALSELIVSANKPRQKHARFCLVDFASTEDRDKAMKKISKNSAETKIFVSIPRTDSEDFIKTLVGKKLKQMEKKREKRLLRRESKKALKTKKFTSTIVILNVPKSASTAQIKELFPDAVDMHIKPAPSKFSGSSVATITLPTTADARQNVRRNLTLGGTKLLIRFSNEYKKKKNKPQKKKAEGDTELPKGPLAPSNENKQKNKKKKKKQNKTNGKEATEEQVTPKKGTLPLSKKRDGPEEGESKVPKKKLKVAAEEELDGKAPQKNLTQMKKMGDSKKSLKKGKQGGNVKGKNFLQKKGNPAPNKKGFERKQNKQKKKKVKAGAE